MLEIFIQTFFLYFIVIDPLGNTPLFLAVTQNMSSQQRVKTALSATVIAVSYTHLTLPTSDLV